MAATRPFQVAVWCCKGEALGNRYPQASQYGASAFVVERHSRHGLGGVKQ